MRSQPLTVETFDYALMAAEYGSVATYERYLELLAEAILNGASGVEHEWRPDAVTPHDGER